MRDIVEHSTIQRLVRTCSVADAATAENAAKALGDLASTGYATHVVEAGGAQAMTQLVVAARPSDNEMVKVICDGLSHLIDHVHVRRRMLAEGIVRHLVAAIISGPEAHHAAIGSLLISICVQSECAEIVVQEGALRALTRLAMVLNEDLQEEVAWALASLSSLAFNAEPMAEPCVLQTLVDLLKQNATPHCVKICVQAVWAVANLSVHTAMKPKLAESGAIEELIRQLGVWSDALEAVKPDSETAETIVLTLQQCSRALANMASLQSVRADVAAGLPQLLRVMAAADASDVIMMEISARTLAHLTIDANIAARFVNAGGMHTLLKCLNASNEPPARVRTESLKVLVNVSASGFPSTLSELVSDEALRVVIGSMDGRHAQVTQAHAVSILANLARSTQMQHKVALIKSGALRQLSVSIASDFTPTPIKEASSRVVKELKAVLTPTSRRALLQAAGMSHSAVWTSDAGESTRAMRRFGTSTPRKSSPLAQVQHATLS